MCTVHAHTLRAALLPFRIMATVLLSASTLNACVLGEHGGCHQLNTATQLRSSADSDFEHDGSAHAFEMVSSSTSGTVTMNSNFILSRARCQKQGGSCQVAIPSRPARTLRLPAKHGQLHLKTFLSRKTSVKFSVFRIHSLFWTTQFFTSFCVPERV